MKRVLIFATVLLSWSVAQAQVLVMPGDNVQALVDAAPAGERFNFLPGLYRGVSVIPKESQHFATFGKVTLSGAKRVTNWEVDGAFWKSTGHTEQGQAVGNCAGGGGACRHPEDLYIRDQLLQQVLTLAEVTTDSVWFFDYANDVIYVLSDPTNEVVELTVTRHAFHGGQDGMPVASGVIIEGFTIEKYANPLLFGAIHPMAGSVGPWGDQWIIRNNVIRHNHGAGIIASSNILIKQNEIVDNGQAGIASRPDPNANGMLIEENVITGNNTVNVARSWAAGGIKVIQTNGTVIRKNHVAENSGHGIWCDIDCIETVIEWNTVLDNHCSGILYEISFAAQIRNNHVGGNGHIDDLTRCQADFWAWRAGILILNSSDVTVQHNFLDRNNDGIGAIEQDRGSGGVGPWIVENLAVLDNITVVGQGTTGVFDGTPGQSLAVFSPVRGTLFDRNTYYIEPGGRTDAFSWANAAGTGNQEFMPFTEWQQNGHDLNGQLVVQ